MSSSATLSRKPSRVLAWDAVAGAIRREIEKGTYPPDAMIPSESELCRQFKVSRVTIRAALQRLVRDGLLVKQQGRGTFVRDRKVHQQAHVGFLVIGDDLTNAIYAAVLRGAENAAIEHEAILHYQRVPCLPHVSRHEENAPVMTRMIQRMIEEDDAAGFMALGMIDESALKIIRAFKLPMVVLGSHQVSDQSAAWWDQVDVDDEEVGRIVGKYLADLGHARIATPAVQPPLKTTRRMMKGLRRFFESGNVNTIPCPWTDSIKGQITLGRVVTPADIEKAVLRIFRAMPRARWPTAIICTDASALAVMRAARSLGLSIPEDISVIGLGDLRLNESYDPSLTSVRLFPEEIGRRGFRILMSRVEDTAPSAAPVVSLVQPELITRLSTGRSRGLTPGKTSDALPGKLQFA